jgi:hypothetical protein
MKKIEKSKRVVRYEPETVYVAEDGTEFSSEEACAEYERAKAFNTPQFTLNSGVLGDDYADWTWFYVRSYEELTAVQNLYLSDDYTDETYDPKPYPKWVCLELEGGGYGGVVGTLEDIEANVAAYVKAVREKQIGILNSLIHEKYPEEQNDNHQK